MNFLGNEKEKNYLDTVFYHIFQDNPQRAVMIQLRKWEEFQNYVVIRELSLDATLAVGLTSLLVRENRAVINWYLVRSYVLRTGDA